MRRIMVVAVALVAVVGLAVTGFAFVQGASASPSSSQGLLHSCGAAGAGFARCHAIVNLNKSSSNAASPSGYGPSDLQSAYSLASAASANGAGTTIAIVDAYNDPNLGYAGDDLDVYRSHYGLPAVSHPSNCPVASGTTGPWFCKVSQSGTTSYPRNNGGWAQEESLDVDMVSAICPNCNILLVEASSNSNSNLGAAVNQAAKLGATAISNSYGGSESSGESSYDTYYNHPGIAITASSGDGGYGVEYPAASPYVTAVGGTSLSRSTTTTRGWTESVWNTSSTEGAGSGCSAYETQQSWQNIANITGSAAVGSTNQANCHKRAVADVSADADPATGVSVYDSYAYQGVSGWLVFGGTSVASPIIASVYGLAGNASSVSYGSYPYSHTSSFFDVTSGSTSSCGSDLCTAAPGWDGPTGLGTPNGTSGF